ncbi:hypothetical protein EJ08DRAFT_700168 [Tothia fuscella]|uniref:Uncharacterized protein n=1 Tax=Tothia fuscella TaxID=1048955 RepID=A0A9P4TUT0_9PEZI|nr:hypothetical protein EJ08DRAFT_700168 [Tothia fuscella]
MEAGHMGRYGTISWVLEEAKWKKDMAVKESSRQPRSATRETPIRRERSTTSSEKRDSSLKRNSFFSMRPKSTLTIASNESGSKAQAEALDGREQSRALPTTETPAAAAESDTSRSRFLFGRSRRNRKSAGTKLRASSPVDADDEDDSYGAVRKEEKHRRNSSADRRMRISNSFGFQHAAKTEKPQGPASKEPSDIFADFRALRKGHRAAVIGPSREIDLEPPAEHVKREKRPPPLRPKRSDELLWEEANQTSHSGMLPLRQIRSAETFSSSVPFSPPAHPTSIPPKQFALQPANANTVAPGYLASSDYAGSTSDEWDRLLPLYESRMSNQMSPNELGMRPLVQQDLGLEPIRSPMFNPPLEQVPEEPEGTLSNRQSAEYPRSTSIRHAKSTPALSRTNSKPTKREQPPMPTSLESPTTGRPVSQGSDTLGDPDRLSVPIKEIERPDFRKAFAETRTLASSWEDDIDFCYQHAAEADCDFDWKIIPNQIEVESDDLYRDDGPLPDLKRSAKREQSHSMASTASSEGDQYRLSSKVYRIPSKDGCPDLDYRSSQSVSTNSITLMTPLDRSAFSSADMSRHSQKDLHKVLAPKILPLAELDMSQFYDDIAARSATPPPAIPTKSNSRNLLANDQMRKLDVPQMPTPPPSANQSPVLPGTVDVKVPHNRDLSVDTIVAQLRQRGMESPVSPEESNYPPPPPPPPKSPRTLAWQQSEIPQLKPRSHAGTLNAAKLKLLDAQGRLQGLGPTSMPRSNSDDSIVTAVLSKPPPPTPPKSPFSSATAPTETLSSLNSPSPSIATAGSSYFTELTSTPSQAREKREHRDNRDMRARPQNHRKVSSDSGTATITPPMSPPPPRSPASATGVRTTRTNYSLFPQPQSQKVPKAIDITGANISGGMMSPPPTGGAYSASASKTPPGPFFPQGVRSPLLPPVPVKSPPPGGKRIATA